MDLIEKLRHARRVSVPIVSIDTADQQALVKLIAKAINGDGTPIVQWDVLRGTTPVNEAGRNVARMTGEGENDSTVGNPAALLQQAEQFPESTIVFVLNADQYLKDDSAAVLQGIANMRDAYKQDGRMLILLSPGMTVPAALKDDVVCLDDPLPDAERLRGIVQELDEAACSGNGERPRMNEPTVERSVEAVQGLSAFAAEQCVAMSLRRTGIDLDHCWATKKAQVEQTRGLSIHRGGETFTDLGGLDAVKGYLRRVMTGRRPPKTIVWLDEIEKTGLASRGDLSGVSQDQEGTLLSWMEDMDVFGVMLLGVPGCGKSAICKAIGSEFGRVVIRIDLGAMMGSLIGQSQQQMRAALKVVEAVGGKDTLWLATSNSIDGLSGAMRSRFTDTFFFDLPTPAERQPIWEVWLKKHGLTDEPYPGDDGWVGRNIRKCCDKAWRMEVPVAEAARYVVPVGVTEREEVKRLREQADGRYLSASGDGVYRMPKASGKRQLGVG